MFKLLALVIVIHVLSACLRFFIDVGKWHKQEKHVKIIPSGVQEVIINGRDYNGSDGVTDNSNNSDSDSGADGEPDGRSEHRSSWNISANG